MDSRRNNPTKVEDVDGRRRVARLLLSWVPAFCPARDILLCARELHLLLRSAMAMCAVPPCCALREERTSGDRPEMRSSYREFELVSDGLVVSEGEGRTAKFVYFSTAASFEPSE